LLLSAFILSGADQAWKNKQYPDWTEEDAKEVMTNSPWAKTVVAAPIKSNDQTGPPEAHRKRIATGGLGIGRSGRRGAEDEGKAAVPDQPVTLTVRWESAQPMREAERKARDTGAPDVANDFYAIAVYGIPRGAFTDASKDRQDQLKNFAVVKRLGKKDVKPTRVDILLRESGPVVLYLFSKSAEFNWRDHGITFEAQISRLKFSQAFNTDDMTFHGNLEL
jgi:hypothetical protein